MAHAKYSHDLTPDEVQNGLWDGKKRVTLASIAPAAAIAMPEGQDVTKMSAKEKQQYYLNLGKK